MNRERQNMRLYVRLGCLLITILLLLPLPFWVYSSRIFVQASPFVTICTILAGGALWLGSILGLLFFIISLFRKRFFCRHVCPVGLILDTVSGIRPSVKPWWKGSPLIGRYIVFLTLAGAIAGYPIFLWMDPLALLNSAFNVYKASNLSSVIISISGMVILLLLSLTSGNLWCACICPLGATQDILDDTASFCRRFIKKPETDAKVKNGYKELLPSTRRVFMAIAAGVGLAILTKKVGHAESRDSLLRPPGAIKEDEFTGLCLRCGNCVRACPSGIIHPDTGSSGVLGFFTPVLRFNKEYCNENCNACTMACPSGALKNLNLEQKKRYVIGIARVDMSLCLWGMSDCNTCIRACPFEAIKITWDEEAYESYPAVDPLKCNGCGACEAYCPTGDIKAIRVWKQIKTN
ncbi:MAG: 4Fe-4S binding protein [Deltaproteobacteria bacterium]|nr:4Fe-4S binding protein [Deltaproteobacteria bacterium]